MLGEGNRRFHAEYSTEWDETVERKEYRGKRREIRKRCANILNDPYRAHRAHPWGGEWTGYMAADLDKVHRIMYKIDELQCVVGFHTIINAHPGKPR